MMRPPPMQVRCVQCLRVFIFTPPSDAIFLPCCKECGGDLLVMDIDIDRQD